MCLVLLSIPRLVVIVIGYLLHRQACSNVTHKSGSLIIHHQLLGFVKYLSMCWLYLMFSTHSLCYLAIYV